MVLYFSIHVSMMRSLVCLWLVFQRSRLCSTTVSTSNTWLSLPPAATAAGMLSAHRLVLPVSPVIKRALHWVGCVFFYLGVLMMECRK